MVLRSAALILLLLLATGRPALEDRTADDVVPMAEPRNRPLDAVRPSVSRGLASLRSPPGACAGEEGRAEVRRAAHDLFDVDAMARRALGHHWKRLSPPEQHEFTRLFGDVLADAFATIVLRYAGDTVPPLEEAVTGGFAQVRSPIAPGATTAIEYRLSRSDSGWVAYDVVFGGVSLVATYRSQLASLVATATVADLLDRMRAESSRRVPCRDALERVASDEDGMAARGRLAAGVLLAAAHARRR